jgi:hypothetical protein
MATAALLIVLLSSITNAKGMATRPQDFNRPGRRGIKKTVKQTRFGSFVTDVSHGMASITVEPACTVVDGCKRGFGVIVKTSYTESPKDQVSRSMSRRACKDR